ncbi:MAG: LysM peptidoglycan-binding domain-containing protein [Cytophagales bacterium]|nr:LysM peptidoglycan-binding domain-containing protein [Cytophagales bacterium]
MKLLSGLFIFFCLLSYSGESHAYAALSPKDSVDVQQIGGKSFIIHKVASGEGLYAIARKYKVSVSVLKSLNPKAAKGLRIGQLVKVPYTASKGVQVVGDAPEESVHIVKPGETLFSIARKYGISTQRLSELNGLKGNALRAGQRLKTGASAEAKPHLAEEEQPSPKGKPVYHAVKSGDTFFSLSRQYKTSETEIKKWNKLASERLEIGQRLIVGYGEKEAVVIAEASAGTKEVPKKKMAADTVVLNSLPISEGRRVDKRTGKVVEVGMAALIESPVKSNKYLAMHRTVPVGTIIQVKNQSNKLSVFVRVVGKLPDTGSNEKILIKVSQKAFDRLGGVDKNFPVEINYMLEMEESENQ